MASNRLFGVPIAALIKKHMAAGVLPAILIKVTEGTRTTLAVTEGNKPTEVPHACRGFVDTQNLRNVSGTLVTGGQKVVVLLGDTINNGNTIPALGDKITIEGNTYLIPDDGTIARDPAAATYTCTVRLA